MERRRFGQWGIELDPDDFACALAALGVLYFAGKLYQPDDPDSLAGILKDIVRDPQKPIGWYLPPSFAAPLIDVTTSAKDFAAAWKQFSMDYKDDPYGGDIPWWRPSIRLEVQGPLGPDTFWQVEQLARREVGAASVYVRSDRPTQSVAWRWPLRIGVLSGQASSEFLKQLEAVKNEEWARPLFTLVTLGPGEEECDLLLFPQDIRAALALALQSPTTLRADCVFVLERSTESLERVMPLVLALRSSVRTSGVGLVYVPNDGLVEWLRQLLRELSHNHTIDLALYRASRRIIARPPFLLASRLLVDSSRLSKSIRSLGKRLLESEPDNQLLEITPENSRTLNIPEGFHSLTDIGKHLLGGINNFPFDSERNTATAAADLIKRAKPALEAASVTPQTPRRIQAQLYEIDELNKALPTGRGLRRNAPHMVSVRIGTESEAWVSADLIFPDDELPMHEDQHKLTVVFSEPRLLPEPQTATVILPRAGDSTECQFYFHTRPGVTNLEARIIVLHRNRVLQTALLIARIEENPESLPETSKVELLIEAVIRPSMADLGGRRAFDAALILNHDTHRVPGIAAIAGNHASFYSPPDLDKEIGFFDEVLSDIADDPEKYSGGLTSPGTSDLLRDFAQHGSLLYESIVDDRITNDAIVNSKRIQVISAEPEARLPVEFLYDRKSPKHDAVLCPGAAAALEDGHCPGTCPTGDEQSSVVCPLGFWGLTKIIERHTHSKEFTKTAIDGDFRFQAEPTSTRPFLDLLTGSLMAASDRVDKKSPGGVNSVKSMLETATKKSPAVAKSWKEWVDDITTDSPSILVLLAHTARTANALQELEISDGSEGTQLPVNELETKFVRNPNSTQPPLVLLIGCETGAPDITFLGFVTKFRRVGAAIVVSTGSTILGRHAAPVARAFVDQLAIHVAASGGISFGDTMLAVRRKLLAQGLPMVLCLMSYGDADWQLRPATT